MSTVLNLKCPDAETLALFATGQIDAQSRNDVLAHLESCDECTAAVLAVNEHLADEAEAAEPPRQSHWWIGAVAAAVIVAIVAIPFLLRGQRGIGRLVAVAPASQRIVEPRLSGGFGWAPYRGPVRSTTAVTDAARLKLGGAAGELIEGAERDRDDDAQHAAGVALVLVEKPEEAAQRLEATARTSHDAKTWSDLAAARYAAAVQLGRASLYPIALAAADEALRIDARLPEALFNRALILERMGLIGEARKAWQRYLDVDSGSQWAAEARTHLNELPATTRSLGFERDRPLLENAAAAGDQARVRELVDRYRQQARTWAEAEYLGSWGEAVQKNDDAAAARWLTIGRTIGDAIHQRSGESLLRDDVASIDAASPAARAAIAEGHVLYRQGRIAHSRQAAALAERDLRLAATRFDAGGSPMALMARYYASSARLAQNDVEGARRELEQAAADAAAHPRFLAFGAVVRWELGRAYILDDDWYAALPVLRDGAELFRNLGEPSNEAFIESMLAGTLATLGRQDESWSARARALRALATEADPELFARGVLSATDAELRAGRQDAALALCEAALEAARPVARPVVVVDILWRKTLIEARAGRPADAQKTAAEAETVARQIPDEALRARTLADTAVAAGAAFEQSDARRAAESLSHAIDFYRARGLRDALPEPLLLRARCARRLGDTAAAKRDLDEGIATVEQRRGAAAEGLPATGVLAAERSLFQEAVGLAVDERNPAAAFAYAERSRGGNVTLAEMQRRLDRSGVVVLEIVSLPRELVTIAVTSRDAIVGRSEVGEEQVKTLARASSGERSRPALTALYDAVVRPVDAVLAGGGRIVVVADPLLEGVPFAALFDRNERHYLVERIAVAIAPSAGALVRDDHPRRAASAVVVGLPSGAGANTDNLPASDLEVQDIARLYAHAVRIAPKEATWTAFAYAAAAKDVDVIHIAGHAERQQGSGDSALLFAGAAGEAVQRISWKSIGAAATRMNAEVVVLAACETLRRPSTTNTRALTLAEAFVAAGAHDVAGTLVPIADSDARELFRSLHQRLAAGDDAVDALRRVQLDAIPGSSQRDFPAWAGLSVLTTRIPPQRS